MNTIFLQEVIKLIQESSKVYIYGAGLYGQNICKFLDKNGLCISGFVVSKKNNEQIVLNYSVYEISEITDKNAGYIIGVNSHNALAIKEQLNKKNVSSNKIVDGTSFIEKGEIRGGYDEKATIEITTRIGCSINCKFCPQKLLLDNYFSENKNRQNEMSIETFKICLEKLPKDCNIIFSGFAEPFLNPNCLEMIRIACESRRNVDLYSTLEGIDISDLKKLINMPIKFMGLHVADKRKYANIKISEEYYQKIKMVIDAKKKNGAPFVNMCNAQTEPDDNVVKICDSQYDILTTMLDRAGNLKDERLYNKKSIHGSISCSICGKEMNHNILLPDGTVVLCCMDYGMKHVLGNLLKQSYEEIFNGMELKRIKKGLLDEKIDILCRNCTCANSCNK